MKQLDGTGEIEIRICRTERRHARAGLPRSEKDRGGAGRFERGAVLAVDEERQLARVRFLDPGNAGDFEVFIALDSTAELFGDLSEFHDGLLATNRRRIAATDEHDKRR